MGSTLTETCGWEALRAAAQTLPRISIKLYHHREADNQPGNQPVPVLTETLDCHTLLERDTGQRGTDRGWGTQAHRWTLTLEAWHGSDSFTLRSGQAQRAGLSSHELGPAYPCLLLPEAW